MPDEEKLSSYLNKSKIVSNSTYEKKIRIAILGGFTLNGLEETMRVKCHEKKIQCTTYVSGYNQYNQEILDEKSQLHKFSPDITFLIIDSRNILGELFLNPYSLSAEERKQFVQNKSDEIINLAKTLVKKSNSKLILSNFGMPSYSPIGINETREEFGLHDMIRSLNQNIKTGLRVEPEIFIYDLNSFVSKFGENNIFNYKQFFYGDIRISLDYIPYLAQELMGYVTAVLGLIKKCIVLDLDNTLWGGIVGEDGFDGIELGDTPNGKAFVEFQKELLSLWNQGIILAINSKNNLEDAMKVISEHPNMLLREKHFANIQINWDDKAINFKKIVDEINIGLNSIVFFDDDKINCERIKQEFPEVLTVNLFGDPSQFSTILKELNDFNVLQRTAEDKKRGEMYSQQRERKNLERNVSNLNDFLNELDIRVKIKKSNNFLIPRISQLTLKTNQFNLTTRRYQEEEIRNLSNDTNFSVGCAQVLDKFGDNGVTGVYIVKKNETYWTIDTFLLSCRIMGRGVENAILSQILKEAKLNGVEELRAEFIPTPKNKPAENFLADYGFTKQDNFWVYKLNNDIKSPNHLKVETE